MPTQPLRFTVSLPSAARLPRDPDVDVFPDSGLDATFQGFLETPVEERAAKGKGTVWTCQQVEVPAADLAEGGGCPFENLFDLTQWLPHHEWLLEVAERRRNQPAAGQQGGTADDDDGGDGDDNDDTGEDGEREDEDIEEEAGEDDNPGAEAQVVDTALLNGGDQGHGHGNALENRILTDVQYLA
jgi:hypothetical protein